jgi:iron complex outermembrane recepter protein
MNVSQKRIIVAVRQIFAAGTTIALAFSVGAQSPTPAPAAPAQQIERIEVTGSNIKRLESETSSLVQVISRTDIERTGKQSIAEVIRRPRVSILTCATR